MKKELTGKWLLRQLDKDEWIDAIVPGCNYTDLMNAGKIEDPFISMNEKDAYWVAEKDWEYKKTFEVTEKELQNQKIFLNFDMLDTICDIYLNDELLGKGENCHIKYTFDVKDMLKEGENDIRIVFYSPVNYVKERYENEKTPPNCNGQNGIIIMRKP
ncbi:MAG: glycoside hydrolase family 2 protein, partial [Clostridiales bacterium]|nr:glycoside hydrolase family 2 protein [Clostridiales bacterium]